MSEPVTSESAWRGRAWVLLAALLWSTSGFFVKAPDLADFSGMTKAFWRGVFAGVLILPLVRQPRWSWRMLPMMLCFAAMCATYICSMQLMSSSSAGVALWLQCIAPVWVLLVGVFLFNERATGRDWFMVLCSFAAVLFILLSRTENIPAVSIVLGLVSSVLYALVLLSLRQLRAYDSAWLAVLNQFSTVVLLAPFIDWSQELPNGRQWVYLACFGVFQLGLPYVLIGKALRSIPSHEVSVLALFEPLLLPLWIYLAWGDQPDVVTVIGGAIILVGLMIRYLGPTHTAKPVT
jgi:drug/metabolite transporter (DMT)-like permease